MSRASLLSFAWGVATTVVAAPIAGFLALFTFGRVILAGAPRRSHVQDLVTNPAPRRPLRIPALIFAFFYLPILWLVGYAWPSAREVPAYPAGAFLGLLLLGTLTWVRSRPRRPGAPLSPAQTRPSAIQRRFTQDLQEAVAQGRIHVNLHGELTVLLECDAEGRLIELSIRDRATIPASILAVAEETLSGLPRGVPGTAIREFVLRY